MRVITIAEIKDLMQENSYLHDQCDEIAESLELDQFSFSIYATRIKTILNTIGEYEHTQGCDFDVVMNYLRNKGDLYVNTCMYLQRFFNIISPQDDIDKLMVKYEDHLLLEIDTYDL